jgi:hypothetical protein
MANNISENYLFLQIKDVAALCVDIASDIKMSDLDLKNNLKIKVLESNKYKDKLKIIADLINQCSIDIANDINL